jgi:hypothetical protein
MHTFHVGADGADDGCAPVAANQEPEPSPEAADDTSTCADDASAAAPEPELVTETATNLNTDAATVTTDVAAVISESLDAPIDDDNRLIVRSSSTHPTRGNTRRNENPDNNGPLNKPKTWRKIIDTCFRNKNSLTHLWTKEVAPRIGIPCPYGNTMINPVTSKDIVDHLKAFGTALKSFYETDDSDAIRHILQMLCTCDACTIGFCVITIERELRITS